MVPEVAGVIDPSRVPIGTNENLKFVQPIKVKESFDRFLGARVRFPTVFHWPRNQPMGFGSGRS